MPRVQISHICRKKVMCQDCLTAALLIVLPSLCLLSRFLANNGNGRLSFDGCFVHQQSVIQHLWRRRLRVWICGRLGRSTAGHCALHQRTAEWVKERSCYGEIRSTSFGTPAEETTQSEGNYWSSCYICGGSRATCADQACATVAPACVRCRQLFPWRSVHLWSV